MPGNVEKQIVNWFDQYYPDWRESWLDSEFDTFKDLSVELKMVPAFRFLEHNIINGGWPQFLWNGFGCWRELIEVTRQGYVLVGVGPEVFSALDELTELCEASEAQCEILIYDDDWRFSTFEEKMNRKYMVEKTLWETLLWSDTVYYCQRIKWLDNNKDDIQRLLAKFTPGQ